jgi:hypothetical protein
MNEWRVKVMKLTCKVFGCVVLGALWCGLAYQAVAVEQDFNSIPTNTPLNSLAGWQAPPDHIIRQTSLINTLTTNTAGYANVGYTNEGVECYIQNSAYPSNSCQQASLWTLTGTNALTQNGGVFQFDVRLTSWTYDGTNVNNNNQGANSGFWLLVGSGMIYEQNNTRVVWTNAQGFGIYFINNGSDNYIYWNEPGYDNNVNGIPGFSTSLSQPYIDSWNRRIPLPWNRDTYYTVQLSNIVFNSSICTQATAVLNIWETDNGLVITNNLVLRAQGGNTNLMTTPFTNVNQIALAAARLNNLNQYDHIILAQPPSPVVSTTVLQIVSIDRQTNDINLTWMTGTGGGQTNAVQVTSGDAYGNYATNSFADIPGATFVIPSPGIVITNYVDASAATNKPSRYYRVRLVP